MLHDLAYDTLFVEILPHGNHTFLVWHQKRKNQNTPYSSRHWEMLQRRERQPPRGLRILKHFEPTCKNLTGNHHKFFKILSNAV
jgi:hypothetical protein